MTPKEKANKIRYQLESAMQDANMRGHYNQAIKQCALILVDEIILANPHSNPFNTDVYSTMEYWQEVKQEIQNL